jgi:hypothetical protein
MSKKPSLAVALNSFDKKPAKAPQEEEREAVQAVQKPPSRKGKKIVAGHFDPAVTKQLKLIGIETDRSLQDMLAEAINDFFQKQGKPPIA